MYRFWEITLLCKKEKSRQSYDGIFFKRPFLRTHSEMGGYELDELLK